MYSIKPCKYAKKLFTTLYEAKRRGVYTKVYIDSLGSSMLIRPKGIDIEFYRPYFDGFFSTRSHDKIAIIDDKIIHLSSYVISNYSIEKWIENGIRIEQNETPFFRKKFIDSMRKEAYKLQAICIPFWVSKYKNRGIYADLYLNIIENANKCIYLLNPYFVPPKEIENSLTKRSHDISVNLLVLSKGDHPIIDITARAILQRMLKNSKNKINLYEYPRSHIHSKIMIADDDIVLIGSGNMDYRSLFDMHETGAFIKDKKLHDEIEAFIKRLINKSVEANLNKVSTKIIKHTVERNKFYRNVL